MEVLLTACKVKLSCLCARSVREGGITLTSEPVSIRKWVLEDLSVMWKRRLCVGPAVLVAASDWPRGLTLECKALCISGLHLQTSGGTSRGRDLKLGGVGQGWENVGSWTSCEIKDVVNVL